MDDSERIESEDDSAQEPQGRGSEVDLPSATIIGANITGMNAGTSPGGIVAPAASAAAAEAEDEGVGPIDLDALGRSVAGTGSDERDSGDEGISGRQSELEAGEPNG